MRLRLLPVLVLTASLALTVRVGDLWQGIDGMARAQTVEKAGDKAATKPQSKPKDGEPSDKAASDPPPAPRRQRRRPRALRIYRPIHC